MEFTSSEAIDAIQFWDTTVELIVYVEKVFPIKETKSSQLLKFYANNAMGREIQCVIWDKEDIQQLQDYIVERKILHIDGACARVPNNVDYNKGNVLFELQLFSTTKVKCLGNHLNEEGDPNDIIEVDIQDIIHHEKKIINGQNKLEVRIGTFKNVLTIAKGEPLQLIGQIRTEGPRIYMQVNTEQDITPLQGDPLPLRDVLLGFRELKRICERQITRDDIE
ncbi:uncharacterized protein LOC127277815 [Leptopilina boulardi]|uniref:uncharacterized protein LOC127277815 n=1 Tax=Leptopilina boulardi TaxID=63433 RepID=UPI0021F61938|nr:uncharacterized protein LOC127277815 [Leptopilina boulardi]